MNRLTQTAISASLLGVTLTAQSPVYRAAVQPTHDPALATLSGGVMLSVPGIHTDFVIAGGGQFVELPNGTARLTGRVFSLGSLYSAFLVDIVFSGRVDPGVAPPAGSPDQQLLASAYAPIGPIDPTQFTYYTAASGTLVGSSNYLGGVIDLLLASPAAQLGNGANNRNGGLGLQASFTANVVQQPTTPFPPLSTATLTVDLPSVRADKATHPQVDPTLTSQLAGRAMRIPWIADDYVFAPAAEFVEHDDGTAELSGRLVRLSDLTDVWDLQLLLGSRIDPVQTGYPPPGSPVQLMLPSAYVGGGGTIDPGHWRYYRTVSGTLSGSDYNDGGLITLTQSSALQVGGGANQTNSFHGFFGAAQPTVTSHPIGRTLIIGGDIQLYGTNQIFPELPPVSLTPPPNPHTLPTLTDGGIVLQGTNLAWTELVAVGGLFLPAGAGDDWFNGYFEILDNQRIALHPRPGQAPGTYNVVVHTQSWSTNVLPLTLTAPNAPTLYAEAAIAPSETLHVLMHKGAIPGPALSAVAWSGVPSPTTFPGLVTLGIGNNNLNLQVVSGSFLHDPVTGIAQYNLGPIPPWFTGFSLHFQAVTMDLVNFALPLPTTNIWTVTF